MIFSSACSNSDPSLSEMFQISSVFKLAQVARCNPFFRLGVGRKDWGAVFINYWRTTDGLKETRSVNLKPFLTCSLLEGCLIDGRKRMEELNLGEFLTSSVCRILSNLRMPVLISLEITNVKRMAGVTSVRN